MRANRANVVLGMVFTSALALSFFACSSPAQDPAWSGGGGGGGAGGAAGGA